MTWLRETFPTDRPVQLRRCHLKRDNGGAFVSRDGTHYCIVLDPRRPGPVQELMLFHEYAHCMAWEGQERDGVTGTRHLFHDTKHFGAALAKIEAAYNNLPEGYFSHRWRKT